MTQNSLIPWLFLWSLSLFIPFYAAANVERIYDANCANCHGKNLRGGSGSSLIDGVWQYGSSPEKIAHSIKAGIAEADMPAWENVLSNEEIRSLVIFIQERTASSSATTVQETAEGVFQSKSLSFKLEKLQKLDGVPWALDFMPGGAVVITQRGGKLWLYGDGKLSVIKNTPSVWVYGQGGLLEVQLHPDYENNQWVYLTFSEKLPLKGGMTKVVRGKIKNGEWVEEESIYSASLKHFTNGRVHFGSRLVFKDGYVYFTIGDRGRQDDAQDLSRPNGKIHRLHDDGRVPKDNPFVGTPNAIESIWTYGNRNPQGLVVDPISGIIWESEHGPRGGDEINVIEKGVNYGWPVITYGMNYNGTPITSETHREGMAQPKHYWVPSIATAGIDIYYGEEFPEWNGHLLVSGMAAEELHLLKLDGKKVLHDEIILKNEGRVRDVAVGPDGAIYVLLVYGKSYGYLTRLTRAD